MIVAAWFAAALAAQAGAPPAPPPPAAPPASAPLAAPPSPSPGAAAPAVVLTLDQALATARAHQPQLVQASASSQAAEARADVALAGVLPQVSGSANYQRATANFTSRPGSLPSQISGGNGGRESWDSFDYYSLGLTAGVTVYDFGQARHRWRASQSSASAQHASEHTTIEQVLFAARSAYVTAQGAKGLVGVAHDTLANQQKHLEQTQGFVEVGTQAPIALAQARTSVANAQVQVITAENGYEVAKAQLNQAMGVEGPLDYDVAGDPLPALAGEDGTPDVLLAEAVAARPEMAALASQVRAQELTVSSLKGAYGPSLNLDTGFTDAGTKTNDLTWNWNAALLMAIPIYSGGLRKGQVVEAEANLVADRAQLDLERQQIRLDVEQARLAVRAAKAALVASGEARENAGEQLRLAEGRYTTGSGSIIELGDAQVADTTAAQQDVVAGAALAQARALLLKALGRD